jgi:hypothetical protein
MFVFVDVIYLKTEIRLACEENIIFRKAGEYSIMWSEWDSNEMLNVHNFSIVDVK